MTHRGPFQPRTFCDSVSCWSRSRGGHSKDLRAGTPLLGGQAGRVGAVQPGEEKAAGRP